MVWATSTKPPEMEKMTDQPAMKLLVLIPALNEEKTIANVIERIPRRMDRIDSIEVVVIDDGSSDRTAELAARSGAQVISHARNRGVGASFQTGVAYAIDRGADIVVNMDADGQFNPEDIPALVQPISRGEADMVTASRFKDRELWPKMSLVKFWGNRAMSLLISCLTGRKYYDVSCGFRAYSRETLLQMNLFGQFTYTQETFLDISFKGIEIGEIPIRVRGTREFGKSRVASNLFKYALQAFKIIFRSFRDYKPMLVFGGIGAVFFLLALMLAGFLLGHYLLTGAFSPHKWAGFTAGLFFVLGLLTVVTGLLADMMGRIRKNQERILYLLKKNLSGPGRAS